MERVFIVHYLLRKGLGPEMVERSYEVAFDDIDPETTDLDLRAWAISETEEYLRNSEDYRVYGKNWTIEDIEEA